MLLHLARLFFTWALYSLFFFFQLSAWIEVHFSENHNSYLGDLLLSLEDCCLHQWLHHKYMT